MARPKKEKPNRADGRYEVKMVVGKNFKGKPIRKSFYSYESKAAAKRLGEQYKIDSEVAIRTGENFVLKNVAFGEWAIKWLETYKKPDVDENTYLYSYKSIIDIHLIPYFGAADLKAIKPVNIKEFYATKTKFSKSLLRKMKMCLNGIFNSAIDNDLCYKNPARSVTFTSVRKKNKKQVYTDEEIKIVESYFMNAMPEVVVLLQTGLRRGELLGLKWDDVDLENKTISVNRAIADKKGGNTNINPPKWKSYRTSPLFPKALKIIQNTPRNSIYIFSPHKDTPESPNYWSQRLLKNMKEMNEEYPNIPILSAHELRHTHGTYLRRHGVDIYSIQKIMGHKNIKMTTEIYVHNEIDALKQATQQFLNE